MYPWDIHVKNYKIYPKLAYFLRKLQTSQANNSRTPRIGNAKIQGYCFYIDTSI